MMAPRGVLSWTLPSSGRPDDRNDDADEPQRLGTEHEDVRHEQHVKELQPFSDGESNRNNLPEYKRI